jgi:methylated-DNA-protein-cysteine methyltransferase-like protein
MDHPTTGTPAFLDWLQDRSVSWHQRVYAVVNLVPPGHVTTYGDVGSVLGSPRYARQVGWALAALRGSDSSVPWQRVINAQGEISSRTNPDGELIQRILLEEEGLDFDDRGRISLPEYQWRP